MQTQETCFPFFSWMELFSLCVYTHNLPGKLPYLCRFFHGSVDPLEMGIISSTIGNDDGRLNPSPAVSRQYRKGKTLYATSIFSRFFFPLFRVSADPFLDAVSRTTFQPSPSLCATNIYYNTRRIFSVVKNGDGLKMERERERCTV